MKVLGVEASTKGVNLAILEGTRKRPSLVKLATKTQKLANDDDEAIALHKFYKLIRAFLDEKKVEKVAILAAGVRRFGGAPSLRPKIEAVVQLAAAERAIPVEMVSPNTLRSEEKKFADATGEENPEQCFNDGEPFVPKDWKDAVLVGWLGIDE